MSPISSEERRDDAVEAVMAAHVVWDNHGCMPLDSVDNAYLPQLQRYRRAGVDVVSLNAGFDGVAWTDTVAALARMRNWLARRADDYVLIDSVEDIEYGKKTGKLSVAFDIEGGCSLNGDLQMVQLYYDLGVRWMLIAYNRNNSLGGGCHDDDCGLTAFGRAVVEEMNRVGMVVCCTHTGPRTTMEVLEYSSQPVILSHSNPLAVWKHPRNVSDLIIKACAASDGVIGINGIGMFLGDDDNCTQTIVRHIDHVAQLVGARHVGLALDFVFDKDEVNRYLNSKPEIFPPDLGYRAGGRTVEPERIPLIAAALFDLGYANEDVAAILGLNHLRIARNVWKRRLGGREHGTCGL